MQFAELQKNCTSMVPVLEQISAQEMQSKYCKNDKNVNKFKKFGRFGQILLLVMIKQPSQPSIYFPDRCFFVFFINQSYENTLKKLAGFYLIFDKRRSALWHGGLET